MRVVIVHDEVPPDAPPDAADTLVQVQFVGEQLRLLGHEVRELGATLDLAQLAASLGPGELVFNLVESLAGQGALIHLAPALVESMGLPMTGCSASAIANTSNKLQAKAMMQLAGIPTPAWFDGAGDVPASGMWIIKSQWEHASIGIGPDSIVDAAKIDDRLEHCASRMGGRWFAEQYIEGREFNLSIMERDGAPVVLPPAEIQFVGYGAGRAKIVDYAAKWDAESHAYNNTPRTFDFAPRDAALLGELCDLAVQCWELFGLCGYARVDFRVDEQGRPWVLEVNTNPCISPDAGFMGAAGRAGMRGDDVVRALVQAALRPRERAGVSVSV